MNFETCGFFVRGLPCSGKSRLVEHIRKRYCLPVVDPDFLVYKSHRAQFTKFVEEHCLDALCYSTNLQKYRYNYYVASTYAQASKHFIWVQPWSSIEGLNYTTNALSKAVPDFRAVVIEVTAPIDVLEQRLTTRNISALNILTMEKFRKVYIHGYQNSEQYTPRTFSDYVVENINLCQALQTFESIFRKHLFL